MYTLAGACLYITRHANRAMAASFGSKPLSFFCRMRYSYLTFQGTCYSHSRKIVIFMDACSLALWSHIQVVLNAIWIFLEKQSYILFCTIDLMISFGHPLAFFRGYCLTRWCKELSEISTAQYQKSMLIHTLEFLSVTCCFAFYKFICLFQ
jgi:hypothetical protein